MRRTGAAMCTASRLGITGHQVLPDAALAHVIAGLRHAVAEAGAGLVGITSLAAGSDQVFAKEVFAAGGQLHAVLPCRGYEATFDAGDLTTYRKLRERTATSETLSFSEPSEAAFYAAGQRVVDLCERLLAVWDGQPAQGLGGTADIVAYARQRGCDVQVIWPADVAR